MLSEAKYACVIRAMRDEAAELCALVVFLALPLHVVLLAHEQEQC